MPRQTASASAATDVPVKSSPTGRHRARSYTQPAFSHLRRSTSDHPDSAVFDEWDEHHPHEDIAEGDEHDEHDNNNDDGSEAPRERDFAAIEARSTSSEHTLAGETGQQSDLSNAEKGNSAKAAAKEPPSKPRATDPGQEGIKRRKTQAGVPAEKREWPDNIVTFDSPDDPCNPKNWPSRKKIIITMLFGMTTMCSTFASSVYSPAVTYVSAEYGISSEVAILGLSLFVLGYVPGPVIFAPISELYGRVPSVLVPMFIFACFSAATATSQNIQSIMITRFFAGLFASAPVANVGGGLADMFEARERGNAVVFYSLAVVAGPTLGPIIGGAVAQTPSLGWRWTEYLTVILICTVLALDIIFIKETFAPVLLTRKARQLRWKTKRWALHSKQEETEFSLKRFLTKNLTLPLRMFVTEPMVLCICLFNSFVYGVLYLLFAAVPIIFEQERGWNTLVGSLPFLAVLLGCITAAAINVLYSTKVFGPHLDRNGGKAEPEMRLPPMMLGSVLFPIGFFLMGWTANPSINWFPCVLGLYFVGTSFLLIFQAGINYLIDAYTANAASAVASNTFLRSIFAAALPLVAQPLFHNLGVQWACTLLGCLSLLLCAIPVLFYKFGAKLRARSKLAEA